MPKITHWGNLLFAALNCQLQFTVIGIMRKYICDCKIIILIELIVQLTILFLGKVLGFAQVHPNHPQPPKTAEVCLVQQK